MKDLLFRQITVFDLTAPHEGATTDVRRAYAHLSWLGSLYKPTTYTLAIISGLGITMIYEPDTALKVVQFAMFVSSFIPTVCYLLGVYLYNKNMYAAARTVVYCALLPIPIWIGLLGSLT